MRLTVYGLLGDDSPMTPFHKSQRAKAKKATKNDAARTVVGYVRVSSQEQADSGVSIDAQKARLASYCDAMGLSLVATYCDAGISGGTLDRPGLQDALAALKKGAAHGLLIAKLDRLTRNVRDLGDLLDNYFAPGRFDLLSVSDSIDTRSAAGRLMLNLLTSVAAWEREAGGERVAAALSHLRKMRRVYGEVAMGLRDTGKRDADGRRILATDAEGMATIKRARALRDEGYSLRQIAAMLTDEGRRTAKGGAWAGETVRSMLAAADRRDA